MVLVFALLVLMSTTLLGVSSVSSSLMQTKMASSSERKAVSFEAAEAAIAGVIFELLDDSILLKPVVGDPFSEAMKSGQLANKNESLSCFDHIGIKRTMSSKGLTMGKRHTSLALYADNPPVNSWSRSIYSKESICSGSSHVIGKRNITCHSFIIRGCGQVLNNSYAVANTLTVTVFTSAQNR